MVRFIMLYNCELIFAADEIYIPIWLDLLFKNKSFNEANEKNLHSNMVRFIMSSRVKNRLLFYLFTFQYG